MTTYTNVIKPSGTSYTNQNSVGKEQYDQSTILYDDTGVFYDGINQSSYTKVSKPLLGGLTWAEAIRTWTSATVSWGAGAYTKIPKPS